MKLKAVPTLDPCELCGQSPCQCDRDDNNPVDCSSDTWLELYARPDYDADHDHSIDS